MQRKLNSFPCQFQKQPSPSSVVCCVQFSADGRYLATGCNRTTQIFDVQTGVKVWYVYLFFVCITKRAVVLKFPSVIADDSAPKSADLYIRSVRFSPDGKLIATGAEDHKIRVCLFDPRRYRLLDLTLLLL